MAKSRLVVKDHGFDALMHRAKEIASLGGAAVKVGVLADSEKGGLHEKGPDGKASPLTVAEIFAILNYGTRDGRIPPRPVLEKTFEKRRSALKDLGAKLIGGVVFGTIAVDQALNIMGAQFAADVKAAIVAGFPPPNAASTARAKAKKGRTARLFRQPDPYKENVRRAKVVGGAKDIASLFRGIAREKTRDAKVRSASAKLKADQQAAISSVKPFIDTGRLLGAITWAIAKKGDR